VALVTDLTEEQEERAAIYEYDAGFSRERAERLVRLEAAAERNQTLTKQQYDVLKKIRENKGLVVASQERIVKTSIRQLINKNLVKIDAEGFAIAV
jgi:hypothetical protein